MLDLSSEALSLFAVSLSNPSNWAEEAVQGVRPGAGVRPRRSVPRRAGRATVAGGRPMRFRRGGEIAARATKGGPWGKDRVVFE